ncbi:MAG: SMC-Scp complex subunit ScpB [Clostridia bacterium]|nr:SMC-Scp complex subunit ScpB [Oscillospiraceae bacterium]MBR2410653.1 SMC-Scp complex subunit ScpB [Clostridia bacterium]
MNLKNTVEAIVFASGEPIDRLRLIEALGCSPERLDAILNEIAAEYDERGSAVQLLLLGSDVQFATRPEYAMAVRNVLDMKRNQPLSSAGFEVLAIVAYNQPVTKAFIEQVRGVDCSGVINTLCQRKLIEECGRLDLPGRPLLYCTTTEFLKCFSMTTLAELPEIPDTKAAAQALEDIQKDDSVSSGQMSIL